MDTRNMTRDQLQAVFAQGWPRAPDIGNALSPIVDAYDWAGPVAICTAGYLRTSLAARVFAYARRLCEQGTVHKILPMVIAQVGVCDYQDVEPSQGRLHAHEYTACPSHKEERNVLCNVAGVALRFKMDSCDTEFTRIMTVAMALAQGVIAHPTLAFLHGAHRPARAQFDAMRACVARLVACERKGRVIWCMQVLSSSLTVHTHTPIPHSRCFFVFFFVSRVIGLVDCLTRPQRHSSQVVSVLRSQSNPPHHPYPLPSSLFFHTCHGKPAAFIRATGTRHGHRVCADPRIRAHV
jgi:hypothetical protein